ncbi:MAG: UDP-N-acetylmuramoyl-L-alanyl-D-glutamate--2,6-diaminopimelate ligase, partial [Sphingomonadales bacterium]
MQLSELVGHNGDFGGLDISGLALDSRQVKPGYLFAALKGFRVDGRQFIPEAVERGAVAVLTGPETVEGLTDVVLVTDPNPRSRLARIAARFFGQQPAHLAAVTGTNGKTSVAHFARQIWTLLGREAASIGTLGVEGTKVHADRGLTTPDCLTFQRTLAELAEMGTQRAVVEASSHGLSQYRLEGARFSVAAFTNLSRDHLDYHQTFEEYFAAKARLFAELLPEDGTAVINLEGAYGPEIEKICRARGLKTIGIALGHGEIKVGRLEAGTAGTSMSVTFEGTSYEIELPLVGGFQASNALVAAGIVVAAGEDPGAVFGALEWLKGVPGRLEAVGKTPAGGRVFVDYAHTPDGLENILQVARTITP